MPDFNHPLLSGQYRRRMTSPVHRRGTGTAVPRIDRPYKVSGEANLIPALSARKKEDLTRPPVGHWPAMTGRRRVGRGGHRWHRDTSLEPAWPPTTYSTEEGQVCIR